MRTPDDPDSGPFQPLGAPIRKPEPPKPWKEVAPGVFEDENGRLRTNLPLPKEKP